MSDYDIDEYGDDATADYDVWETNEVYRDAEWEAPDAHLEADYEARTDIGDQDIEWDV